MKEKTSINYHVFKSLSKLIKNQEKKKLLKQIAQEEKKQSSKKEKAPSVIVFFYQMLAQVVGVSFVLKLLQENNSSDKKAPTEKLTQAIDKNLLEKRGIVVYKLHDALVELTGGIAGLIIALENMRLVAVAGLITGFAASVSLAMFAYTTYQEEETRKKSYRSALDTGLLYSALVLLMLFPYFLIPALYKALAVSLLISLVFMVFMTLYTRITHNASIQKHLMDKILVGITIALITFAIGYVLKYMLRLGI